MLARFMMMLFFPLPIHCVGLLMLMVLQLALL
jgi:hypothetical protein